MRAFETPIQSCFSSDCMVGAYYHEYNENNKEPHSVHRYDKNGKVILNSTKNMKDISKENIFYLSDRFGNRINV